MKWKVTIYAGLALFFTGDCVLAHHSGVMFDSSRSLSLTGVVREFQWTNPHGWIQLVVEDNGNMREWSIELGSQSVLYRAGWRPGTLKSGQTVTLLVRPLRDGSAGGLYLSGSDAAGIALGASSIVGKSL